MSSSDSLLVVGWLVITLLGCGGRTEPPADIAKDSGSSAPQEANHAGPAGALREKAAAETTIAEKAAAEKVAAGKAGPHVASTEYVRERHWMVEEQLRQRGIRDTRVLEAMERVPRHVFVPPSMRHQAYADGPLPIGHGQTISQPYIVALMTELVRPAAGDRALDIGTGSGYQAAVLAELVKEVWSMEIVCPLADSARERLQQLGYTNIEVRCGDGYQGWVEKGPFQIIVVAAAPDRIPQPLLDQLAPGGRLVIPVGRYFQELTLVEKQLDGSLQRVNVAPVAFVPMTGEAQK